MKTIGFVLLALSAGASAQIDLSRDIASTPKSAYLILPPTLVCEPLVTDYRWSGTGRYLFVQRKVMDKHAEPMKETILRSGMNLITTEFVVCDTTTGKNKVVDSFDSSKIYVNRIEFLTGSDSVIVEKVVMPEEPGGDVSIILYLCNAATGTIKPIFRGKESESISLDICPTKPSFVIGSPTGNLDRNTLSRPMAFRKFDENGTSSRTVNAAGIMSQWYGPNGDQFGYGRPIVEIVNGKRKRTGESVSLLDFSTGRVTLEKNLKAFSNAADNSGIRVISTRLGKADTILLQSTDNNAKELTGTITSDGTKGLLSPKVDAVAYLSIGSAYVRKLTPIDRAEFEQLVLAKAKAEALSKAKQMGLGLIMCASDFDDNLPKNDENWQAKLGPYMKDRNMMNGFVYTFAGGSMSGIADPATAELGYVGGPGGRAVVYADGHAKWVNNP